MLEGEYILPSFIKIKFDSILYLKSDHVYVELFLKNNKSFLVRMSLINILASLSANFMRVHRSYVVNIKYITEIKTFSVKILQNEIPLGKKFKKALIDCIHFI